MTATISDLRPIGTIARTGDRCPESGSWTVVTQNPVVAAILAGQIMPRYLGQTVTWRLIRYGL